MGSGKPPKKGSTGLDLVLSHLKQLPTIEGRLSSVAIDLDSVLDCLVGSITVNHHSFDSPLAFNRILGEFLNKETSDDSSLEPVEIDCSGARRSVDSESSGETFKNKAIAIERRVPYQDVQMKSDSFLNLACSEQLPVLQDMTNTIEHTSRKKERHYNTRDYEDDPFYDPFCNQKFPDLGCHDERFPPREALNLQADDWTRKKTRHYGLDSFKTESQYRLDCSEE